MDDPKPVVGRVNTPITPDVIRRTDEALEATKGNRAHAISILGITMERLESIIYHNPYMKAKWTRHVRNEVLPNPVADIHRPETIKPYASTDEDIAAAVKAEDALWELGYEKLNFTPDKKEFLGALMKAHGNHWKATTHLFQGGISYTATELLFMFHKLEKEIQRTLDRPEEFDRHAFSASGDRYVVKAAHEFRLEMMDRALSIADMFRKLNSDSERAQLLMAQVEKLKVNEAKSVKQRKRGAWTIQNPEKPVDGAIEP